MSGVRQNYSKACEAAINKLINMELYASYIYQAMSYHFDTDDIALKGCFTYFKKQSAEEREHAEMFMEYQNKRGGRIVLADIKAPLSIDWNSHRHALEDALAQEKEVNDALLAVHGIATENNDAHLTHFLKGNFLNEKVDSINELAKLVVSAKRCADGLGVYQFDLHSMQSY